MPPLTKAPGGAIIKTLIKTLVKTLVRNQIIEPATLTAAIKAVWKLASRSSRIVRWVQEEYIQAGISRGWITASPVSLLGDPETLLQLWQDYLASETPKWYAAYCPIPDWEDEDDETPPEGVEEEDTKLPPGAITPRPNDYDPFSEGWDPLSEGPCAHCGRFTNVRRQTSELDSWDDDVRFHEQWVCSNTCFRELI